MRHRKQAPIGIFDSGIGGLTVAKAIVEALPNEDIVYFGDTARVPYGIKSQDTVKEYALEITRFLLQQNVKMIVIACNTVSASAKQDILNLAGDIPVLDVITSGTEAALTHPKNKHIGVIGTLATVNSKAYETAIHSNDPDVTVTQHACPLLVPLAEEGWVDNEIAIKTLDTYLQPFIDHDVDSLILGCTHYPLFKSSIQQVLHEPGIQIVDSAESIARTTRQTLTNLDCLNEEGGAFHCYVSDRPQRFQELAERFLGRDISDVRVVHL